MSYEMNTSLRFCVSYDRFKMDFIVFFLKLTLFQMKTQRCHGRRYDITCTHKMLFNVWSYDFYDMTLSIE